MVQDQRHGDALSLQHSAACMQEGGNKLVADDVTPSTLIVYGRKRNVQVYMATAVVSPDAQRN